LIILGVVVLRGASPAAFAAVATTDPNPSPQAGTFIMTPGTMSNGNACLWVIDMHNSDETPSLAFYVAEAGKIRLQAARRIKYDFSLMTYNDSSADHYSPAEIKRSLDELSQTAKDKAKK